MNSADVAINLTFHSLKIDVGRDAKQGLLFMWP